jgi:hypothetical protein
MKIVTPANPIKIYMRHDNDGETEYMSSNIAFIIVDDAVSPGYYDFTFVTISGTQIANRDIAFARVFLDGAWVSHE